MLDFVENESEDLSEAMCRSVREFDPGYHEDFRRVRVRAKNVMDCFRGKLQVPMAEIFDVADELRAALRNWGADKRKPATTRAPADIARGLHNCELWRDLLGLEDWGASWLDVPDPHTPDLPKRLLRVFGDLGRICFSTQQLTIVYPGKALLLLTGIGPAFDGRVRAGLTAIGIGGWTATHWPLPSTEHEATSRKMMQAYRAAAGFCFENREMLRRLACEDATIDELLNQLRSPGRLIDILLFMRGLHPRG